MNNQNPDEVEKNVMQQAAEHARLCVEHVRCFGLRSADLVASAHREELLAWFVVVSKASNEIGADFYYEITDDGRIQYSEGSE